MLVRTCNYQLVTQNLGSYCDRNFPSWKLRRTMFGLFVSTLYLSLSHLFSFVIPFPVPAHPTCHIRWQTCIFPPLSVSSSLFCPPSIIPSSAHLQQHESHFRGNHRLAAPVIEVVLVDERAGDRCATKHTLTREVMCTQRKREGKQVGV